MRYLLLLLACLTLATSFAQEDLPKTTVDTTFFTKVDSLYREDQFYVGINYNLLTNVPKGVRQNGFSSGISAGFLRDMPLNEKRTFAIAVGAGLSYANYRQNLVINEEFGTKNYEIVDDADLSKGKIEQFFIDVPIEFRWRNSTPTSYKFWRIYTGFKVQYAIYDRSKHEGIGFSYSVTNNKDLNKLQFGPYIAVGFNTWNFQAYYGLNPMFKNVTVNNESLKMKTLNLGLMFYIL
ncbi:porin family protein [Flavobacterium antarcticum]|uniref:porin family protein n=1 Tax=Flavobacterium antarcticum TaxID=271155 RepID=UPI0003B3EAC2|nr:porin family protein [Flavobacterium antarcticum]